MEINRGSILIDALDAYGQPIRGAQAAFYLYNHRLRSLDLAFRVKLGGSPILLADVPAFPHGSAELVMDIERFHTKKRFVNVQPGEATELTERFLLRADAARVKFPGKKHPAFSKLAMPVEELGNLEKAGLLNLWAKAGSLGVTDRIISIVEVRPARIFAVVEDSLLDWTRDSTDDFHPASGISHKFKKPWSRIENNGSFKTTERQANLQLTFATDSDNRVLVDMDIDDNQGIAHAFDVIGHSLTGADTHPYNIHQVLVSLQGIHPGYDLS